MGVCGNQAQKLKLRITALPNITSDPAGQDGLESGYAEIAKTNPDFVMACVYHEKCPRLVNLSRTEYLPPGMAVSTCIGTAAVDALPDAAYLGSMLQWHEAVRGPDYSPKCRG